MPLLPGIPSDIQAYQRDGKWYVHYTQDGHQVQVGARDKADALFKKQQFEQLLARPEGLELQSKSALKTALGHMANAQLPFRVVKEIAPALGFQHFHSLKGGKTLPLAMVVAHIKVYGSNWGGKGKGPAACEAYWMESPLLKAVRGSKSEAAKALTYRIASALQKKADWVDDSANLIRNYQFVPGDIKGLIRFKDAVVDSIGEVDRLVVIFRYFEASKNGTQEEKAELEAEIPGVVDRMKKWFEEEYKTLRERIRPPKEGFEAALSGAFTSSNWIDPRGVEVLKATPKLVVFQNDQDFEGIPDAYTHADQDWITQHAPGKTVEDFTAWLLENGAHKLKRKRRSRWQSRGPMYD